jgi:glycosyltransferase involved in cell wall biosynthesis
MSEAMNQGKSETHPKVSIGMPAPPLITTIIPTYRRPKLLRRAIKSVLNQTYPHIRVCVYDNASNDETADVVADLVKKDSRVSYYCHSENIGAFSNFNFGLKNVRTPFFSFLADDNILLPEFYEMAIKGLYDYPEAAFYATEVIFMEPDGIIIEAVNSTWGDGYYLPPEGLLAMFENGRHPPAWTGILFRSIVIEHIGLIDEEVGGPIDRDYVLRIAARFPYGHTKVPGAIIVMHPASISATADHSLTWPGSLKMIRNLTDDSRIPPVIREQVSLYLTKALKLRIIAYGKQYIIAKKYDNAYRVADILYSHLGAKLWALMIYTTAKCCRLFPYLHSVLLSFIGLRHRLSYQKRKVIIPDAEKYTHYLNEM